MNTKTEIELETEDDTTVVDSVMMIVGISGCACKDMGIKA